MQGIFLTRVTKKELNKLKRGKDDEIYSDNRRIVDERPK